MKQRNVTNSTDGRDPVSVESEEKKRVNIFTCCWKRSQHKKSARTELRESRVLSSVEGSEAYRQTNLTADEISRSSFSRPYSAHLSTVSSGKDGIVAVLDNAIESWETAIDDYAEVSFISCFSRFVTKL